MEPYHDRKRPCCVCRKWFTSDVRQRGRQKTCSEICRKEHHRRACSLWNKKNAAYHKANYLSGKLEKGKADKPPPDRHSSKSKAHGKQLPPCRPNLSLPREVIGDTVGTLHLIILEYVLEQVRHKKREYG